MYKQVSSIDEKNKRKFVGNPVNAYVLIRMLTEDIGTKFKALASKKAVHIEHLKLDMMPKKSDFNGALAALNRLVKIYRFSLDDVIKGKFSETAKSMFQLDGKNNVYTILRMCSLTNWLYLSIAFDTYHLANNSIAEEEYNQAYFWANKTLQLLSESDKKNSFVDGKQVYQLLTVLSHKVS